MATRPSSSLDHILEDLLLCIFLHPSTQKSIDKEVGRSLPVSQSVKGSKRTNARYSKDLYTQRRYTCVSGSMVCICPHIRVREGQTSAVGLRYHTVPSQLTPGLTRYFRSWSKHPCQSNRTFWVDEDLNICLRSAGNLSVWTKSQTKGWDRHLSSPASHEIAS